MVDRRESCSVDARGERLSLSTSTSCNGILANAPSSCAMTAVRDFVARGKSDSFASHHFYILPHSFLHSYILSRSAKVLLARRHGCYSSGSVLHGMDKQSKIFRALLSTNCFTAPHER